MICTMVTPLDNDNYVMFAMKHYDNPQCADISEFEDDLNRTKYLKRLFKKYENSRVLKERLILNHIIVLCNLFGVDNTLRMLEFKLEKEFWPTLKTCLLYLGYVDEEWKTEIPLDEEVTKRMREI